MNKSMHGKMIAIEPTCLWPIVSRCKNNKRQYKVIIIIIQYAGSVVIVMVVMQLRMQYRLHIGHLDQPNPWAIVGR